MMRRNSRERGGSTLVEFTLVGIPLMFVLISVAEICRGMWTYHTLAYAVRQGTRYAIVHGSTCAASGNTCTVKISDIASIIQSGGVGLDQNKLNLTFAPKSGGATTCLLKDCLGNSTVWPPSGANDPGTTLTISGSYPFQSAIAMFWPGSKPVGPFPAVTFPASSQDMIQF